jgi:hypothetical protein
MRRWSLLFKVFLSEYLHLRPEVLQKRERPTEEQPVSLKSSVIRNQS